MWVSGGVIKVGIDGCQKPFAAHMFKGFGFVVDFGPIEAKHAHQKCFDKAMATDNADRNFVAGGGQLDPLYGS